MIILAQQNNEKAAMLVYQNVLWELNASLMLCVFLYHEYQKLLGSLRKDVLSAARQPKNCLYKSREKALTCVAQKRSRVRRKTEATSGG